MYAPHALPAVKDFCRPVRPPPPQFAYVPGFNDEWLTELAAMAEPEDWDGGAARAGRHHQILRSYLLHTFDRAESQGRIGTSPDGDFACFDTGLFTPLHEAIYMFFVRNDHAVEGAQPWRFRAFRRSGDTGLACFPELPARATYVDDPSQAMLDPERDIRVNVSHIIGDHRERLPESTRQMSDYQLSAFIEGVVSMAIDRVAHDSQMAVPQCFNGRLQWLLPLSFEQPGRVDVALTIEPAGESYRAATCLTLQMAYKNARLIARPDQAWLRAAATSGMRAAELAA